MTETKYRLTAREVIDWLAKFDENDEVGGGTECCDCIQSPFIYIGNNRERNRLDLERIKKKMLFDEKEGVLFKDEKIEEIPDEGDFIQDTIFPSAEEPMAITVGLFKNIIKRQEIPDDTFIAIAHKENIARAPRQLSYLRTKDEDELVLVFYPQEEDDKVEQGTRL